MGTQKGLDGSCSSEGRFPKGPGTGEMVSFLDSCNAFKIEGEEAKIWHSKKAGNNTLFPPGSRTGEQGGQLWVHGGG